VAGCIFLPRERISRRRHLRAPPRHLFRHDGGHRRHHRVRRVSRARGGGRAGRQRRAHARRVDRRRHHRARRRADLRRAGRPAAALATLIVAGLCFSPSTAFHSPPPPSTAPVGVWAVGVALGAALVPVLFAYGGWQQTNFIAEELVAPERDLPRALVLGVVGV